MKNVDHILFDPG